MEIVRVLPLLVIFTRGCTLHISLDAESKYKMWWHFNDTDITIKVEVKTTGWIAWGLSPNGNMKGSDMVIGWIDNNGEHNFNDRHALGNFVPLVDKKSNYRLLNMTEHSGKTTMSFSRKIKLCNIEDFDITLDTMRVIYAWNDDDPINKQIHKHSNRGVKSIFLLDYGDRRNINLPEKYKTLDLLVYNHVIPAKDTSYWCKTFKMPEMTGKHHLVRVDPIITNGNEAIVHHMLLYQCRKVNEKLFGNEHDCLAPNMPDHVTECMTNPIHAWNTGGSNFYFPEEAGLSLNTPGDPRYIMLEIHYDNPLLRNSITDNSGVRAYYTSTLRKYDAAIMIGGIMPTYDPKWISQIIPPKQESFTSYGFCSSECLDINPKKKIPKIFAISLHTHLTGKKVIARLVRDSDGLETARIDQDFNYDFNYQEFKYLPKYIDISPGHSIHVECTYQTKYKKEPVISGGGNREEMCIGFLYYYPKMNVKYCASYSNSLISWPRIQGRQIIASNPNVLLNKEFWNKDTSLANKFEKAGEMEPYWKNCTYADESKRPRYTDITFHKPVKRLKEDACGSNTMLSTQMLSIILQLFCTTLLMN